MTGLQHAPVVAGVDGSPHSWAAAELAAGEAVRRHRPLRLVHGYAPPAAYSTGTLVAFEAAAPARELRAVLRERADRLRGRYPGLTVTTAVTDGYPAAVLIDESLTASLVVVGSRGLGGIRGMLAGSVGAQVAAHAFAPVIVVHADPGAGSGTGVVVGVDGSAGATAALEFAFEAADGFGNRLTAIYAWPARRRHADGPPDVEGQADADRYLAEQLAGWSEKYPDVTVERRAVPTHNPLQTLVSHSRDAGLVVVGPRGRGGFAGLLLGSVSDGLVRHAHRPVAVVHARLEVS